MQREKAFNRFFQVGLLVLTVMIAFTLLDRTAIISYIGQENIYWERARFLAGQECYISESSSLCSLGYSLFLVPICLLVNSPYAAYKIAILLNCVFFYAGYIISVIIAKKMFEEENQIFLSFVCFIVAICPIFTISKIFTGPDTLVIFLVWIVLYQLIKISENGKKVNVIILAACLIGLNFLKITLLPFSIGIAVMLMIYVKQHKVSEEIYVVFLISLLTGMFIGVSMENSVLFHYTMDSDISLVSSFAVFKEGIETGWKNGYLLGIFRMIFGKMYILIIGSLLTVLAGFFFLFCNVRVLYKAKKGNWRNEISIIYLVALGIQLITISIYDNAKGVNEITSLFNIEILLPFLLVVGLIQIKNTRINQRNLLIGLGGLCLSTFATAATYRANGIKNISSISNSVLFLWQLDEMNAVSTIYFATCVILAVSVTIWFVLCKDILKKNVKKIVCLMLGIFLMFFCLIANDVVFNANSKSAVESNVNEIGGIAAVLNENENEVYYLNGSSTYESNVQILQSLMPTKKINIIQNAEISREEFWEYVDKENKEIVLVTGVKSSFLDSIIASELENYAINYMTNKFVIWTRREAEINEKIEKIVENRIENIILKTEKKSGKKKVLKYGGDLSLAPGTYSINICFQATENFESLNGTIKIKDSEKTITQYTISSNILNENGVGIASMEFSSRDIMEDIMVEITLNNLVDAEITEVYYRKIDSSFTIGINDDKSIKTICQAIEELDEWSELKGKIAYIANNNAEFQNTSLNGLQQKLSEYDLKIISKDMLQNIDVEYLIASTTSHSFFDAMDRYSIIKRERDYTLLVKNDSLQAEIYQKHNKSFLSKENRVSIDAFETADESDGIVLEAGTYRYNVELKFDDLEKINWTHENVGMIVISNADEILVEQEISVGLLEKLDTNVVSISIPFALRKKSSNLVCKYIAKSATCSIELREIEIISEKYQFGAEEELLSDFYTVINSLGKNVTLSVVVSESIIENGSYSLDFLQNHVPDADIRMINYSQAKGMIEDTLLLTFGISKNYMELLGKYSIVGHAGQYTLWARDDGSLLQKVIAQGGRILNSGDRISPESIAAASGNEYEKGVITGLPAGTYDLLIELDVTDVTYDDTIEIIVYSGRSEEDIEEDIEALIEEGYTKKEARRTVVRREKCGSATFKAYQFEQGENLLVLSSAKYGKTATNLTVDAYTWNACDVEGKIVWVTMK